MCSLRCRSRGLRGIRSCGRLEGSIYRGKLVGVQECFGLGLRGLRVRLMGFEVRGRLNQPLFGGGCFFFEAWLIEEVHTD